MTSTKAVLAVVLAVALLAGPASGQAPPRDSTEERIAALEELAESQEALIGQQQALIDEQEALLNTYRCMFKVDVEMVPGDCPGPALSEEEVADGELMCTGWIEERKETQSRLVAWTNVSALLKNGTITMDNPTFQALASVLDEYHARVSAVIPSLKTERLIGLMVAMADAIRATADAFAQAQGITADEMAAVISIAIDRLGELDAALDEICGTAR